MWAAVKQRKITSVIIALLLFGGGYYGYKKMTTPPVETHYVLTAVQRGTLITSVSGTGQIAVSNQVEVRSKVSGDIVTVLVENSQTVKSGVALVRLDAKDAQKTVRDAAANLESAKIALAKLKQPADAYSMLQAKNALVQSRDSKQNAQDTLKKAYDDGFNIVANAFIDIPAIMTATHDILYGNNFGTNQNNADYYVNAAAAYNAKIGTFRDTAIAQYQSAKIKYDQNFADYKSTTRLSGTSVIEDLINETYTTAQSAAEAVKSAINLIQLYEDALVGRNLKPHSLADTQLVSLNSYTSKLNAHLANLLTIQNTITDSKNSISAADRAIAEKIESLVKLKAGTEVLDIQSQELTVKQRSNSLLDAQERLGDYTIRAPFGGIVAKVNIKKSDSVSANASIVTLITAQQMAQISLNEVDAAKIKLNEKATLTFDAVPDVSVTGEVAEIDALGTVAQGVVTYMVKIVFDTQDARVKPGMTVSAAIITHIKQDAILVPNGAIKIQGGMSYVEVFDRAFLPDELETAMKNTGITSHTPPRRQRVETGMANDASTEVISGLKEGDIIIARKIVPVAEKSTTPQAPSLFGSPSTRGASGGNALRGVGR